MLWLEDLSTACNPKRKTLVANLNIGWSKIFTHKAPEKYILQCTVFKL